MLGQTIGQEATLFTPSAKYGILYYIANDLKGLGAAIAKLDTSAAAAQLTSLQRHLSPLSAAFNAFVPQLKGNTAAMISELGTNGHGITSQNFVTDLYAENSLLYSEASHINDFITFKEAYLTASHKG